MCDQWSSVKSSNVRVAGVYSTAYRYGVKLVKITLVATSVNWNMVTVNWNMVTVNWNMVTVNWNMVTVNWNMVIVGT